MLIFYRIVEGEVTEDEYKTIFGISFFGPLLTGILIIWGLGYLLITIPYRLIFWKGKDDEK